VQEFTDLTERSAWSAWFLENHDHSRIATRYAAGPGSWQRRARVAAMMVCTLRGTPFLYQGQELGLPDARIPPDRDWTSTAGIRNRHRCRGGGRPRPGRAPDSPPQCPGCRSSRTPDACAWNPSSAIPHRRSRSCVGSSTCGLANPRRSPAQSASSRRTGHPSQGTVSGHDRAQPRQEPKGGRTVVMMRHANESQREPGCEPPRRGREGAWRPSPDLAGRSAHAGHPDEDLPNGRRVPGHGSASVVAAIRVGGHFDRDSGRYPGV
jgi:Alpha amylase, catalytic domain